MTGKQLNTWRETEGISLRDLAVQLGGEMTHTTLSRWEREDKEIPQWVTDKLLGETKVELPLSELHQLLDLARIQNLPFDKLLAEALREYLAKRKGMKLKFTKDEYERLVQAGLVEGDRVVGT
jgi:transcriptional regulator with XRE-family HTH domain